MGLRSHLVGDGDAVGFIMMKETSALQLVTECPAGDFARVDAVNHYKVTNVQEVSNPVFVVFVVK
jgi:hypothetical protein